jgi:hypothetical protein
MAGKLGLGIYAGYRQAVEDAKYSCATTCLLFEDALAFAGEIKSACPQMVVVGRVFLDDIGFQDYALRQMDDDGLRRYVSDLARRLAQSYPNVDCWQLWNEPYFPPDGSGDTSRRLRRIVASELAFADALGSYGRTVCALNFSSGSFPVLFETNPYRQGEMKWFSEIVNPLLRHPAVKFIGLHCYGSPGASPHGAMKSNDAEWFALRYRGFVAGLVLNGCGRIPPLIITEYGQCDGWRGWMSEEQCKNDLLWFGDKLNEDEYVYGSAYFCDGTIDPGKWGRFDIMNTSIPAAIAAWNAEHPVEVKKMSDITQQYADLFKQWVAAGGVVNNFRKHLLGIGVIKPTPDDLKLLANEAIASDQQLKNALDNFFK